MFRTRGTLTLPGGVTKAAGCSGKVRVQIKRGKKVISTRTVKLGKSCTYSSRVSFANRRLLRTAKKLTITARFLGNVSQLPVTASVRSVRVRS